MTKKLTTLTNQDTDLNLADENVAKMIVAANVDNQKVEVTETPPPELPTGKTTTFTMKLSTPDVAGLMRQAEASNKDWRTYLTEQIQEHLLEGKIGKPVISQPSKMSARISGFKGGIVKRG